MLKIIQNNPYRYLGVYSNSSVKDRIANTNKLKAYLKVGKSVVFPLDLSSKLSSLERSLKGMDTATSGMNLPDDQLKYALFWFIQVTPIDKIALDYLVNGNFDKADELFQKKEDFSSLINRGVLAFIRSDNSDAISSIMQVIHDDKMRVSFVNAVCGNNFVISEQDLTKLFIEAIMQEIPHNQVVDLFGSNEKDAAYAKEMVVNESTSIIGSAIASAKSAKRDDADAQYEAGMSLMESTKDELALLEKYLFTGKYVMETYALLEIGLPLQLPRKVYDQQYVFVSDNLAKQILQCGINYYNCSKDEIEERIEKAHVLQAYALSIAQGKLTKDRCRENVDILNEKKESLPPGEVRYYDSNIQVFLRKYASQPRKISYAIELIELCAPSLMSIKDKIGDTNPYYLKISTLVVNAALSNVIDEFNSVMGDKTLKVQLAFDRESVVSKIKSVFGQAWGATLLMDKLDMEPQFKTERYKPNRESLKSQVKDFVNIYAVAGLEMRTEKQIFDACKSINDYNRYLKFFPKGTFASKARKGIEKCEFEACRTVSDCLAFVAKHPRTTYPIEEKKEKCFYDSCKTISQFEEYCQQYPAGRFIQSAKRQIDDLSFKACSSKSDYESYLSHFPTGNHRSKANDWLEEERVWQHCVAMDTKEQYKDYLAKYPNGRYKSAAEQKASACYVATMIYGDYDHPQVIALRRFRDNTLRKHYLGRLFIRFYYKNSPKWVEKTRNHHINNKIIKVALDCFVKFIG